MDRIKFFFILTDLKLVIIFLEIGNKKLFTHQCERLFLILLRGMAL